MALAQDQQHVVNTILSVARRRRASPMEIKAALETGIVESNLRNLPGGDADSQGWRQERASLYANPTNLAASVNRFFNETAAVKHKYGNAGDLAAAVQRPAAQYRGRYAQVSEQADALLRQGGATARRRATAGRGGPSVADAGTPPTADGQSLAALLLAQPVEAQRPTLVGLATPGFAAGAVTPQGAVSVQASAPQREGPGEALSRALTAAAALGDGSAPAAADAPESSVRTAEGDPQQVASGRLPLARRGKIIGTPHAGTHTLGNWQSDNAVDVGVPVGTPMVAVDSGVVVKVRHHSQDGGRFAGDQITIRGSDGNEYFYAHGTAAVKPGQRIKRGQSLGRSGSANGVAHLHFGVAKGDPRKLFG